MQIGRGLVSRSARLGAVLALASAGAVTVIGAGPAGAEPVSVEFGFTGGPQEFVVPECVTSLTVDAFGAQGGLGADEGDPDPVSGLGGEGGRATATIPVTPGETLVIMVGGEGHDGISLEAGSLEADGPDGDGGVGASGLPADGLGGFNGGGDGGTSPDTSDGGGGGGGASDVRQGGDGLEHRVVVAGGGGGGGGDASDEGGPGDGNGGDGGGEEGTDGSASGDGSEPGLGGTQTAGGAAGGNDPTAAPGELGQGGTGGNGNEEDDGGGGGGGGYYGGGGGSGSFDADDGAGGGGGSGFGPAGTVFETGNQFGDGLVILTYDPDATPCAPIVVEPRFTG